MPASQHQIAEIRHRNCPGRQEAADHGASPRKSSASPPKTSSPTATTRPRCRWTTSSRCKYEAERQADPGHRDHADAGRRGQDHHHGRPQRRAQPHRQEGDAAACASPRSAPASASRAAPPAAAMPRSCRWKTSTCISPATSTPSPRRTTCSSALIDNHIYWGNALGIDGRRVAWRRVVDMNDRALREIVCSLGGVANGYPARGRLRHHRRLRSDGDLLPRQGPRRPQGAPRQHHRRLHARPQAGARRRPEGARRDDRAA